MNTKPLDSDARGRFKIIASSISFDGLSIPEQVLGKTILAGIVVDDTALTHAPLAIENTPGLSAPLKRIFEAAFDTARKSPTLANGAMTPKTTTVVIVASILGLLVGSGLAIMIVD